MFRRMIYYPKLILPFAFPVVFVALLISGSSALFANQMISRLYQAKNTDKMPLPVNVSLNKTLDPTVSNTVAPESPSRTQPVYKTKYRDVPQSRPIGSRYTIKSRASYLARFAKWYRSRCLILVSAGMSRPLPI
jgi:hypothetical protein